MQSTYDELMEQQHSNETAAARVVGLYGVNQTLLRRITYAC